MPELPEVETIAEDLRHSSLIGSTIISVEVTWPSACNLSIKTFIDRLCGQKIKQVGRRGKFLIITLSSGDSLLIHLRMTGRLTLSSAKEKRSIHEHIVLTIEPEAELRYHDTRKFGRWYLVADPEEELKKLGPEPLEKTFTLSHFREKLKSKSRQLKPLLLDQQFLAGLGNIYVDEALWEAKLHPLIQANHLTRKQSAALFKAIHKVLKKGLERHGTSLGKGKANFYRLTGRQGSHQEVMNVFRQTGSPCPRCGHEIIRIKVGQRSTHICPSCQKN